PRAWRSAMGAGAGERVSRKGKPIIKTFMIRTAEAVSPAHPDKLADQVSDMILQAALAEDPDSRVAVETLGGHGQVYVVGEMTTHADIDIPDIVRQVLRENRYEDFERYAVTQNIVRQS